MSRSCDFGDNNLDVILRYSPFKTEKELKNQFDNMKDSRTGTMIIIYNLSRLKDGTEELDFNSDPEDILCPESYMKEDTDEYFNPLENVPRYKKSLKAYCTILYMCPKIKIFVRKVIVKTMQIPRMLTNHSKIKYRPRWLNKNEKSITIVLGMVCEDCEGDFKDNCGFFLYNRNRLIKAFEKIGCQKQANEKGAGVIGVAELDILTPTHNKQDFCPDRRYNTVMNVLSMKLLEYWSGQHDDDVGEAVKRYKKPWVQCHQCFQWRSLPSGIYPKSLPDEWFCHMNNGSYYNRCEIEEEPDIEMANKKREKRNLRSLNKKKYSESLELEAFNERDSEETSPPTKQPIRKVAKRNLKSSKTKLNCLKQFPCVPTSSNVKQPLPGCSRDPDSSDSDETVLHGSPSKELHTEEPVQSASYRYLPQLIRNTAVSSITDKRKTILLTDNNDDTNGENLSKDKAVQTTLTYDENGLTPFHKNVYRLLNHMAKKNTEVIEESKVEDIVKSLLELYEKCPEINLELDNRNDGLSVNNLHL